MRPRRRSHPKKSLLPHPIVTLRVAVATLLLAPSFFGRDFPRLLTPVAAQGQQDPQTLNGGSILAMAGDGCVAVAVDKRFGSGPQTVNVSPRLVLVPHSRLLVAFTGLEGDVRSLSEELSVQVSSKMGRSSGFGFGGGEVDVGRAIAPRSMAALTSHVLYSRRRSPYYVEPIVAGLERVVVVEEEEEGRDHGDETCRDEDEFERTAGLVDPGRSDDGSNDVASITTRQRRRRVLYRPFLCSHDLIGAQSKSESFVCSGAASKSLFGTAEAMWQPGLKPDELARVCGRAFLSALERDCLSGYGAIVYVITGDCGEGGDGGGIVELDLACRND